MNTSATNLSFRGRPLYIRYVRFFAILTTMYACYALAKFAAGDHVLLINYITGPLVLVHYFLFYKTVKKKKNNLLVLEKKDTQADISRSFFKLILLYLFFILSFSWFPAIFIFNSLDFMPSSESIAFVEIIKNYNKTLWLVVPWPHILMMVSFFSLIVKCYGIETIKELVNKICGKELENDTQHNAINSLFCGPYFVGIFILLSICVYALYLWAQDVTGAELPKGKTLFNLILVFFILIVTLALATKKNLRKFDIANWSIFRFMIFGIFFSFIFTALLLSATYFFSGEYSILFQGNYTYLRSNLRLQFYYFVLACWWFSIPIIAYHSYCIVSKLSFRLGYLLVFFAMAAAQLIISSDLINESLCYFLANLLMYSKNALLLLVFYTIIIMYYLFYNKYDRRLLAMQVLQWREEQRKLQPIGKNYHSLLQAIFCLLLLLILENVFLLQNFIEYFPLINTSVFLYLLIKARKLAQL